MRGTEALQFVRKCFREGKRYLHPHCLGRMKTRGLALADISNAIIWARSIEPYAQGFEDLVFEEGEAWRIVGPSLQIDRRTRARKMISVGVYLVTSDSGEMTIVVTLF